ncbi:translational activator for mitochondrial COX1 [Massospora cicadina]|nr:translational activator for mitochondrial COX1 [Massospora cicadina]
MIYVQVGNSLNFKFPGQSSPEDAINLSSWDTFFVTRLFKNVDDERSVRHVSKLLTYPLTIASVLCPFGPHRPNTTGLTLEGEKSLAALRYTIEKVEKAPKGSDEATIKQKIRVFVLGARAEAQLPPYSYLQLCYLLPNVSFQIHFIGPEALPPTGVPEKRDYEALEENYGKELDWLLQPTLNPFRSLKADLNLQDVRMTMNANHGIMGIRGKRYEIRPQ